MENPTNVTMLLEFGGEILAIFFVGMFLGGLIAAHFMFPYIGSKGKKKK